jgi:putative intracellular protease/amidase
MKKVLFLVSEWGYWGEELIGPLDACDRAGYQVVFATPKGGVPTALGVSMNPSYVDPPLGRSVTDKKMADWTKEIACSARLSKPISLEAWLRCDHEKDAANPAEDPPDPPDAPYATMYRPYPSHPRYLRRMERYYNMLDRIRRTDLEDYAGMVIVGGSGALVDLANNSRVHDLVLGFYQLNKPIAAECYGVTCLAFARDLREKKSLIWGRRVTGHPVDYDYLDGTGFEGPHAIDGSKKGFGDGYINFGSPFYPLEYILRDAVGPDGEFLGNVGHQTSVIVDYPFITSRSTAESSECGRVFVEVLEKGLIRYGWGPGWKEYRQ